MKNQRRVKIYHEKYTHNIKHNEEDRTFLQYYRDVTKYTRTKTIKLLPSKLCNITDYVFIITRLQNIYMLQNLRHRICIHIAVNQKCKNIISFKKYTEIIYLSIHDISFGEQKEFDMYSLSDYKGIRKIKNRLIQKYAAFFAACEKMEHDSIINI